MKYAVNKIVLVLTFTILSLLFAKDCRAQVYDYERMSSAIVNMLNAATDFLADNFEIINTHGAKIGEPLPRGEAESYKGINPEGFANMVGKMFTRKTGIGIKFASYGRGGKIPPRNSLSKPDKWEKKQLKKFAAIKYPKGVGYGEVEQVGDKELYKMDYRYIYPLYVEYRCLKCHGNPKRSPTGDGKDLTGYQMEDYKEGELIGAISITFPIE